MYVRSFLLSQRIWAFCLKSKVGTRIRTFICIYVCLLWKVDAIWTYVPVSLLLSLSGISVGDCNLGLCSQPHLFPPFVYFYTFILKLRKSFVRSMTDLLEVNCVISWLWCRQFSFISWSVLYLNSLTYSFTEPVVYSLVEIYWPFTMCKTKMLGFGDTVRPISFSLCDCIKAGKTDVK